MNSNASNRTPPPFLNQSTDNGTVVDAEIVEATVVTIANPSKREPTPFESIIEADLVSKIPAPASSLQLSSHPSELTAVDAKVLSSPIPVAQLVRSPARSVPQTVALANDQNPEQALPTKGLLPTETQPSVDETSFPVVASSVSLGSVSDSSSSSTGEQVSWRQSIKSWRWWVGLPFRMLHGTFDFVSLVALLGVASTFPILQLASLGYMLEVGRRVAAGEPWRRTLPGLSRAGRLGVIAVGATLTWLPVFFVTDYAYSAELISSGSRLARNWQIAAWIVSVAWVLHVSWAALRGGKWYHFLWPAPLRFVREIWRPATWRRAEDAVWSYTVGLQLPRLIWLGLRAAVGAIIWLVVPSFLIIMGMRGNENAGQVLIGFSIGSLLMAIVLMYLPFLQIQMARENRFRAIFDVRTIRADFKRAPWAFFISFLLTLALALPLYIFRIERLPDELLWLPCLFFVLLMLPARFLVGWALRRGHRDIPRRFWLSRWVAWTLQLAPVPFYLMFLYIATFTSWDGALVVIAQHAFLVPVPFAGQ